VPVQPWLLLQAMRSVTPFALTSSEIRDALVSWLETSLAAIAVPPSATNNAISATIINNDDLRNIPLCITPPASSAGAILLPTEA
jgi:hypothetical protein